MKRKIFTLLLAACLLLSFSACSEKMQDLISKPADTSRSSKLETTSKTSSSKASSALESSEPDPAPEPTPAPESQPASAPQTESEPHQETGMRPEFKEAMDSYEAFMNEYVEFMKKYKESPNDLSLLADYTKFISKYSDMTEKFDTWDEGEMSDEELSYYIDVSARIQKKLLEVA